MGKTEQEEPLNFYIISDIHSNFDSLEITYNNLKKETNETKVVILGDILTYGLKPIETINLLLKINDDFETHFLIGNHDQIYFDIQHGLKPKYHMSAFVKNSVDWTLKQIQKVSLYKLFNWKWNYQIQNIFFSHAIPFEDGNWSYLEQEESLNLAFNKLDSMNAGLGVFGHSHRQRIYKNSQTFTLGETKLDLKRGPYILNAGSIGQPRGNSLSFCKLALENDMALINFEKVDFKYQIMINDIMGSDLDIKTKSCLMQFWAND